MSEKHVGTRREFLKNTGYIATAAALAGVVVPRVHAAEDNTIRVALIGCGGRGAGAAVNALAVKNGPVRLVAMADVFANRLDACINALNATPAVVQGGNFDAPPERRFLGFDAYRKAMDCLRPGDVAILATPPAFRWAHFSYAIEKGLNVFMEKPTTVDGPTTKKMLALADASVKKNLKVGVGLMWRHCKARQELHDRVQSGQIGEILAMRAYRMHGPIASFASKVNPGKVSDLLYQIERFHSFLWASGGCYSDFYIHAIDECCWMKGGWPIRAEGNGGRHYRGDCVDQNFDNYSVEYTFADGAKLFFYGRCIDGCLTRSTGFAHGTKGLASLTEGRIFSGQNPIKANLVWKSKQSTDAYQCEWDDLIDAIRGDKPYNETRRGAEASLVSSMGRMAAHTGQAVTFDDMLECPHEFAPDVDKLTMDSPAPLPAGPDGRYPVPQPGIVTNREYEVSEPPKKA